jgi:hypothetical protein
VIVLDTNVVSALMQRDHDPVVIAWLDGMPAESVWTTSITVLEVRLGLELLAAGRRRSALEDAFARTLAEDLEQRVLPFDEPAARWAAQIAAAHRRAGSPVEFRDVEIAGICAARRAMLATRNVRHFEGLGFDLVNPWADSRSTELYSDVRIRELDESEAELEKVLPKAKPKKKGKPRR